MANHKSALKRVRQTKTRTDRNRQRKETIKKLRKETIAAIERGSSEEAAKSFSQYSSAVDKAAKTGLLHRNKAANLKSKAAHKFATLS